MIGNLKGDDDVGMDQKTYRDGVVRIGRDGVGGKTSGISSHPRRAGDAQYCRRRRGPRTSTRGTNIWGNRLDQDQKLRSEVIFVNILADHIPRTAKKSVEQSFKIELRNVTVG